VALEKMTVTGSFIPATLDEQKAMPIQIIDSKMIEMSGVNTNVLDVLRKTVPQIQGSNNIGVENANISGGSNGGASNVALRNVDTLVLFNGKRMAAQPGAAGGGVTGVDLNLIPLSAVEQIQVLTDGASAIYGSDAVSGVINIILKKDYRGAEFSSHYSMAEKDNGGQWDQKSIGMVVGTGTDKTNVLFTAEWTSSDPLWARHDLFQQSDQYGLPPRYDRTGVRPIFSAKHQPEHDPGRQQGPDAGPNGGGWRVCGGSRTV
jgi:iron complex outermembrane receptor protein